MSGSPRQTTHHPSPSPSTGSERSYGGQSSGSGSASSRTQQQPGYPVPNQNQNQNQQPLGGPFNGQYYAQQGYYPQQYPQQQQQQQQPQQYSQYPYPQQPQYANMAQQYPQQPYPAGSQQQQQQPVHYPNALPVPVPMPMPLPMHPQQQQQQQQYQMQPQAYPSPYVPYPQPQQQQLQQPPRSSSHLHQQQLQQHQQQQQQYQQQQQQQMMMQMQAAQYQRLPPTGLPAQQPSQPQPSQKPLQPSNAANINQILYSQQHPSQPKQAPLPPTRNITPPNAKQTTTPPTTSAASTAPPMNRMKSRSPSMASMLKPASTKPREKDDDTSSITSTSSSKSFSGFMSGMKRGILRGIGISKDEQQQPPVAKTPSPTPSVPVVRGRAESLDQSARVDALKAQQQQQLQQQQQQFAYANVRGNGVYAPGPGMPPQLQQQRYPGPPPPGFMAVNAFGSPVPGPPPVSMYAPGYAVPSPGLVVPVAPVVPMVPQRPAVPPPPVVVAPKASPSSTPDFSKPPPPAASSADAASKPAPLYQKYSFDTSEELDSKPLRQKSVDVPEEKPAPPETRTPEPQSQPDELPLRRTTTKSSSTAATPLTLTRKFNDFSEDVHPSLFQSSSLPRHDRSSLDRSLGRSSKNRTTPSNTLTRSPLPPSPTPASQHILHEDILLNHRDVSHLFWAGNAGGDVGTGDVHPAKLLAESDASAAVLEDTGDFGSLLRKRSLLSKQHSASEATGTVSEGVSREEDVAMPKPLDDELILPFGESATLSRTRSFKESHIVITAEPVSPEILGEGEDKVLREEPVSFTEGPVVTESKDVFPSRHSSLQSDSMFEAASITASEPHIGDDIHVTAGVKVASPIPSVDLSVVNGVEEKKESPVVDQYAPIAIESETRFEELKPTLPTIEITEAEMQQQNQQPQWSWSADEVYSNETVVGAAPATIDAQESLYTELHQSPEVTIISDTDDHFAYPDHNDPHFNGFPRFPLHIEKTIYQLSHAKLAQPRRPLIQQVMVSNLMLYILSVHADVTLQRQGPRKKKGKKKKGGKKKRSKKLSEEEDTLSESDDVKLGQTPYMDGITPLVTLSSAEAAELKDMKRRSMGDAAEELAEYSERQKRRNSRGSDTSSIGSDSSWTSQDSDASDSETGGSSFFGKMKKKESKGTLNSMMMGLSRVMGRGMGKKKSEADDDDVPLAILATNKP
ncbi:hypothetical protein BCR33DRAFT_722105 [Rhizoclosmatium globosum]|uniref:Protein Zds1 C-terminal domain-containing protein n=1 Tax=Rhizoclosmatium globosum TaxID=329046 RepID=A0A1Y2BNG6_9FUNG|nr:hypothetical protein BCR33DRAFT_722105 [Rhizoclosmatium globosum]|eukprot:ORY36301.1 hypothetical protein BCR33DRAFT_722105 [Rhizoclosmatium globosum]